MAVCRLTPRARRDLDDIWDYTAERWGEEQAVRYIETLRDAFARLSQAPCLGRRRDDVRDGYRSFPAGRHQVFYLVDEQGIVVVRVLHQRMDPAHHV